MTRIFASPSFLDRTPCIVTRAQVLPFPELKIISPHLGSIELLDRSRLIRNHSSSNRIFIPNATMTAQPAANRGIPNFLSDDYRLLSAIFDAHGERAEQLTQFAQFVRDTNLTTDQFEVIRIIIRPPPGGSAVEAFFRFRNLAFLTSDQVTCTEALLQAELADSDNLDGFRQFSLHQQIDHQNFGMLEFMFTNIQATDEARNLFGAFPTYIVLNHSDQLRDLGAYEAPAGNVDAPVVHVGISSPDYDDANSFAAMFDDDECPTIKFIKELLPGWRDHLSFDLVPKRRQLPPNVVNPDNEAIFGSGSLLGVYFHFDAQMITRYNCSPQSDKPPAIILWDGFVCKWFERTFGGGDAIVIGGVEVSEHATCA